MRYFRQPTGEEIYAMRVRTYNRICANNPGTDKVPTADNDNDPEGDYA